jgi:hypothetical protein
MSVPCHLRICAVLAWLATRIHGPRLHLMLGLRPVAGLAVTLLRGGPDSPAGRAGWPPQTGGTRGRPDTGSPSSNCTQRNRRRHCSFRGCQHRPGAGCSTCGRSGVQLRSTGGRAGGRSQLSEELVSAQALQREEAGLVHKVDSEVQLAQRLAPLQPLHLDKTRHPLSRGGRGRGGGAQAAGGRR